jgi:GNAT superfamily N-acetyltransferase
MNRREAHVTGWLELVGGIPGAAARREGGVTWCASDIPWPMFNAAVARPDADVDVLAAALGALRDAGRPWFLFVHPDTPAAHERAGGEAGAEPFDDRAPWMEARRAELAAPVAPEGITTEEAFDEASWRRWAACLREVYGFPELAERSWCEPAARTGWRPPWRAWTALRDGRPVGCTLLVEAGGVASLFGVGTVEDERGRGIGRHMTLLPLAHATTEWCGFWSTPDGNPLYRSLGFTEDGWVTRWLGNFPGPPPDAARG